MIPLTREDIFSHILNQLNRKYIPVQETPLVDPNVQVQVKLPRVLVQLE